VEVKLHSFLNSALDVVEWSASRHVRFNPTVRDPGNNWVGG